MLTTSDIKEEDEERKESSERRTAMNIQKFTQKSIEAVNLLVSVFIGKLFALIDCFNGLLCKFLYIHSVNLLFRTGSILLISVLKPVIAWIVSTVKS